MGRGGGGGGVPVLLESNKTVIFRINNIYIYMEVDDQ